MKNQTDPLERVTFVHFRAFTEDGSVSPTGGYTFCYTPTDDAGSCIGVSKCSITQGFCSKQGRGISYERATNEKASRRSSMRFKSETLLTHDDIQKLAEKVIPEDIRIQSERHGRDYSGLTFKSVSPKADVGIPV